MTTPERIASLLVGPVNHQIRPQIIEICDGIKKLSSDSPIVPAEVFEVVGLTQEGHPGHDFVGGREYYYFENCWNAVKAFKLRDLDEAKDYLLKAKWDFDNWALAHYLLGCVYLEIRRYKDALDQFEKGADFEPFNHRPVAIMREIARYLTLNP